MVSFNNIKLNQKVEVWWRGRIFKGTVKYKGCMNGQRGDWVGVALELPVGEHDGMINGRRYFACMDGHGIFTQAYEIRFQRMKRNLYSTYRTVHDRDFIKEDLFGTRDYEERDCLSPVYAPRSYSRLTDYYNIDDDDVIYAPQPRYSLRHSVGNSLQAATMKRPTTARANYSYNFNPIHVEYENDFDDFHRSPSIPPTHMPYQALKEQCRRGWDDPQTHLVRDWSVNTGRDSLIYNRWNGL